MITIEQRDTLDLLQRIATVNMTNGAISRNAWSQINGIVHNRIYPQVTTSPTATARRPVASARRTTTAKPNVVSIHKGKTTASKRTA